MNVFAARKRVTLAKPLTNSGESAFAHFCAAGSRDQLHRA
jgi:hypothetical protein